MPCPVPFFFNGTRTHHLLLLSLPFNLPLPVMYALGNVWSTERSGTVEPVSWAPPFCRQRCSRTWRCATLRPSRGRSSRRHATGAPSRRCRSASRPGRARSLSGVPCLFLLAQSEPVLLCSKAHLDGVMPTASCGVQLAHLEPIHLFCCPQCNAFESRVRIVLADLHPVQAMAPTGLMAVSWEHHALHQPQHHTLHQPCCPGCAGRTWSSQ